MCILYFCKTETGKTRRRKCISGKGRLTLSRTVTFQNFYGLAIKRNKGHAQNVNESFHNTLWKLSPKNCHNSVLEIQFSLHLATLIFNQGYEAAFSNLLESSGISQFQYAN